MVGDHVSILMRGSLESTTDDMIAKDTYHVSFVSHSGLLQCQYPASVVSIMRSLYIDLNEMVTQDVCTLIDGVQVSDYNPLSKYNNTKSNVPVVCPVVSTTSDPLLEDDSDNTDNDENEVSCPLHQGGYKRINYSSNDKQARKKYKLSPLY